jgi:NAD(P)-dependent dehydrogenase (short-subunit alcohol dehydrogenase family)
VSGNAITELFSMVGKSVLVTGAASGLGRSISEVMVAAGAEVTCADVDAAGLEVVARALRASGGIARTIEADVANAEDVRAAVRFAESEAGRLDVVFANAGISAGPGPVRREGRLENIDLDRWDRVMAVNLTGVLTTLQAAVAPLRRSGGGKIVVTASIAGLSGNRLVGYAYAASKAAVANVVRQAALDLARDGIQVNAIAPGAFATNIGGARVDPSRQRQFALDAPAGRVASANEVQGLALFLASGASSYVTGAIIPIDGGTLAGVPIADAQPQGAGTG